MSKSINDPFVCPSRGHCDLNLPLDTSSTSFDTLVARLRRLHALNYSVAAFNVTINQQGHKSKLEVMSAESLKQRLRAKLSEEINSKLLILSRLTVNFEDNNVLPLLNTHVQIKEYDILCLAPSSSQALQQVVKSGFRFDLVRYNDRFLPRKLYNECINRNAYFELNYAPLITNRVERSGIISRANALVTLGRKKNVVVSSGAEGVLELRSPLDVANMTAILFNLGDEQSNLALGKNCLEVIRAAAGRRLGPYRARVRRISDLDDQERWKLPKLDLDNKDDKKEGKAKKESKARKGGKARKEGKEDLEEEEMQKRRECRLAIGRISTPIGVYTFEMCQLGLHSMRLDANITNNGEVKLLEHSEIPSKSHLDQFVTYLRSYFGGGVDENDVLPSICLKNEHRKGSDFRCQVWKTLRDRVGPGKTLSYASLAQLSSRKGAARAIGSAMSNNPVPLITPCHRVIRADGHSGNYSKATQNDVKIWLLNHEQRFWGQQK